MTGSGTTTAPDYEPSAYKKPTALRKSSPSLRKQTAVLARF
jgi:hypothetical protein